jgi:hypothetical protein
MLKVGDVAFYFMGVDASITENKTSSREKSFGGIEKCPFYTVLK